MRAQGRPGRSLKQTVTRPGRLYCKFGKRALDIGGAVVVLVLTAPLQVGAAVLIRWQMGNPILFRQERPGLGGGLITLLKFRTMTIADSQSPNADEVECRITRLGRVLRSTSIDELPGLWNVLKGDMSLVGPRPLRVEYLDRYSPYQARRHEAKPGITGLAQVNGRNLVSWEDKFDYDVWYVDNVSLVLDLRILIKTLAVVLKRTGISAKDHDTVPEFMGSGSEIAPSRTA